MSVKVNMVLDDDVKAELDNLVEAGSRSRVINDALRKELLRIRRRLAAERMDVLRKQTRPASTKEILRLLRRDRSRR